MALAFFGGAFSSVPAANLRAVLLNVNSPETRGTMFAFYNLMVRTAACVMLLSSRAGGAQWARK
jgi:MFS-type transporter involved in bile tolerance (Atg22 family)